MQEQGRNGLPQTVPGQTEVPEGSRERSGVRPGGTAVTQISDDPSAALSI